MTAAIQPHRIVDAHPDQRRTGESGTDNAFGQLLRSMEHDMWANACRSSPDGHSPTPARIAPARTESRPGGLQSAAALPDVATPVPPTTGPRADVPQPSMRVAPRVDIPDADAPRARSSMQRWTAYDASPQASCPDPRGGPAQTAAARAGDETLATGVALPAAYVPRDTAVAPFRVTVLPGDAPAVAIRFTSVDPDDLETLDSHIRAALLKSGLRTSTLLINGIDCTVTATGENTHGD
ncbi:hypothetical protein [Burkholderia stagnalis]|uniref:hypothetical protein n=1 Tax=Burkholderia stagnalis TaxID=1503054 RepID=UPI000F5D5C3C|nr:hypothetical protein [Burkholderia stagnalis]